AVAEPGPAAEDVVEDSQGVVVGMVAGDTQVAQHDVDLVARLLDAPEPRSTGPGNRGDRGEGPTTGGPSAEGFPDQPGQPAGIEVAGGDHDGALRREVAAVMLLDIRARQPGNLARGAPGIPAHRMGAVDQPPEAQLRTEGRIIQIAPDLG